MSAAVERNQKSLRLAVLFADCDADWTGIASAIVSIACIMRDDAVGSAREHARRCARVEPPLSVNVSIACPVVVPTPVLTSREAWPVAEAEVTPIFTGTAVPCVTLTALPEFNCKAVVVAVNVAFVQLVTRLLASTEPRPVAKSYPGPVL